MEHFISSFIEVFSLPFLFYIAFSIGKLVNNIEELNKRVSFIEINLHKLKNKDKEI